MVKKNSCVFISGAGTNLKALIHSSRIYNFPINIKLIVSSKKNALGLVLAKKFSIPYKVINTNDRFFYLFILIEINKKKISLICLAGFMKILSKKFIKIYKGKIINIHPSLLPKYKGINTFSRILKNKENISGCTVHFVNENLDSGKIILKKSFNVSKEDSLQSIKEKTQKIEHLVFSRAVTKIYNKG